MSIILISYNYSIQLDHFEPFLFVDSSSREASHISLAVLLTRNNRWHSSYTVSWILAQTRPCKTVALCKSNHLCKASSRSLTLLLRFTSEGPHRKKSRTDFTWVSDTARSLSRIDFSKGVIFALGRRWFMAFTAIEQSDTSLSSFLAWRSSPSLKINLFN